MKYEVIVKGLDYDMAEKIRNLIQDYSCCIETQIREE